MIWILEVLEGPRQGTSFKLFAGLSIGRKQADINLGDAKISSVHAMIEEFPGGSLVLVDNKSRNGIYANGTKIQQVKLESGLLIQMGRSHLRILSSEESDLGEVVEAPGHWRDVLVNFNNTLMGQKPPTMKEIQPFKPILDLEFTHGQQISTRWTLGYGPRKVGSRSLDLPIFEKEAPAVCFKVEPSDSGALYVCDHPETVKLNGDGVKTQVLRHGDVITIGNTTIKIHLTDV